MERVKEMIKQEELINFKGHPFVGVVWPVVGSKGDLYEVEMTDHGFTCDCPAYVKCKHIKSIEARLLDEIPA